MNETCECYIDKMGFDGDYIRSIVYCPLHAATSAMLVILERLEWDRLAKGPGIGRDYERCCGVCDGFQSDGHALDCELDRLLAAAKGGR